MYMQGSRSAWIGIDTEQECKGDGGKRMKE